MSATSTATDVIFNSTSIPSPSSPYANSNPTNDWSALTIASILVTVMGFVVVVAAVFWIFRREKLAREEERREANTNFWPGCESVTGSVRHHGMTLTFDIFQFRLRVWKNGS
ncbi:hypothetical protein BKA64DRAFT_711617 [Cadophora sp. MPI-SDFR-AT-0126]|nr:hypothetical protein BKA64DRAFT_711617 [Leotiomycetes sp. MPI-SDFR-AT-0126]